MACNPREIAINKACSVKLDDETIAIVAFVYHTADRKDPNAGQSWYKTAVRVAKVKDLEAEIADKLLDENRLKEWTVDCTAWPKDWHFAYDNGYDKCHEARWLSSKIKKAMEWDDFVKLAKDGIRILKGTKAVKQSSSAKYDTEGYTDGTAGFKPVSIIDREALLKCCGKIIWKDAPLKRAFKQP